MVNHKKYHKGFTLVELSIALVIIGLIVGGVVGGQSLVKSSKINSALTEVAQYNVADNTFDIQYDAMPGDFTEATDYWPADSQFTGFQTENGNGNNIIGNYSYEHTWAWQLNVGRAH